MWPLAALAAAACSPGPANWMPIRPIQDNTVAALPFSPRYKIACCNGTLGAIPFNSRLVTNVVRHEDNYYALLETPLFEIDCPNNTAPWPAPFQKSLEKITNEPPQAPQGFSRTNHRGCFPLKTYDTTFQSCTKLCNSTPGCDAFEWQNSACHLCSSSRKSRTSANSFLYSRSKAASPPVHEHHPKLIAGSAIGLAFVFLLAVSFYSN